MNRLLGVKRIMCFLKKTFCGGYQCYTVHVTSVLAPIYFCYEWHCNKNYRLMWRSLYLHGNDSFTCSLKNRKWYAIAVLESNILKLGLQYYLKLMLLFVQLYVSSQFHSIYRRCHEIPLINTIKISKYTTTTDYTASQFINKNKKNFPRTNKKLPLTLLKSGN